MLIPAEEDLFQITGAELYLEMWGGHPGTAGKRVSVNGRSTYWFPRLGAEDGHCTYSYPVIPLVRGDLVNGWNAFQLALDQGTTFWGQHDGRRSVPAGGTDNRHPDVATLGLAEFSARIISKQGDDAIELHLDVQADSSHARPGRFPGLVPRL